MQNRKVVSHLKNTPSLLQNAILDLNLQNESLLLNTNLKKLSDQVAKYKLSFDLLSQMIKKTAVKHIIREMFTSLLPDIEDESDFKIAPPEVEIPEKEKEYLVEEAEKCDTLSALKTWFYAKIEQYGEASFIKEIAQENKKRFFVGAQNV